jgi:hypothetical protein
MNVGTIKRRLLNTVGVAASSVTTPKVLAGLSIAIAIVKLAVAIDEFRTAKSTRRIGYDVDR